MLTRMEQAMKPAADGPPGPEYSAPTAWFDFDRPIVRDFAARAAADAPTATDKAVRLYYAVRDGIRYDPYSLERDPATYRASRVLADGAAYCIPKAILLVAAARACGIPAGLGLADVTNHLCTERLLRILGGNRLFPHHGYAALRLDGRWVKAAPAFNIELCDKFDVAPSEFDGRNHALLQEYDRRGRRHMDYVADHGVWPDFPYDRVMDDLAAFYPATVFDDLAQARADNAARAQPAFADERRAPA